MTVPEFAVVDQKQYQKNRIFFFYVHGVNVVSTSNNKTTVYNPINDCFQEQHLKKQSHFLT